MKEKPCIQEKWIQIAKKPDLEDLPQINNDYRNADETKRNQPNDHCIYKASDKKWHLWACVRNTPVGRLLCHWSSPKLTSPDWNYEGHIRADKNAGESQLQWHGQEFLQSPFVVQENGKYYMFYGGYCTGRNSDGQPDTDFASAENQICLMTSTDGLHWERYQNSDGLSRVFVGPGGCRDEYLIKIGQKWHIYYTGHHNRDTENESIFLRTSYDLIHGSEPVNVHYDRVHGIQQTESPIVIERNGIYYLFRTGSNDGGVLVVKSNRPDNFHSANKPDAIVTTLPGVIAPEMIEDSDGQQYMTNILSPEGKFEGIWIAPLKWDLD